MSLEGGSLSDSSQQAARAAGDNTAKILKTSKTIAIAISPAARKLRARRRLRLSPERAPSRRVLCKSALAANMAGTKPKAMPAIAERRSAKPKTK